MTRLPAKYIEAQRALAAAVRVDQAKAVRDKAAGLVVYAQQARDVSLLAPAVTIKVEAETRAGELLIDLAEQGKRPKGRKKESHAATLSDLGIKKDQSSRWQKLARLKDESPREWQKRLERIIRLAVASCVGERSAYAELRAEAHDERKKQRAEREHRMAGKIMALPDKRYGVILADPEWRFETYSPKGKTLTSAENHYDTSELDEIKARDVPSISAADCVLFLWATVPMLPQALEVMQAWGFKYVSGFAWIKDKTGTGYWAINKHEHLLIGTRGNVIAPAPGTQWASAIEAPVGKHSEKPEVFHRMIESYFPTIPKIELNARKRRPGWDSWGTLEHAEAAE